MTIYYLALYWHIEWAGSLKDKRKELKSLVTLLRKHFNVSVTEGDHRDKWQLAEIEICGLAPGDNKAHQEMEKLLAFCNSRASGEVMIKAKELL